MQQKDSTVWDNPDQQPMREISGLEAEGRPSDPRPLEQGDRLCSQHVCREHRRCLLPPEDAG